MIISIWTMIDSPDWSSDQLHHDQLTMIDIPHDQDQPHPESIMPRYPAPAAPAPVPATSPVIARNAGAARPIPPAPIRTPDFEESPMFDVTDKRAVDRLAAVVVMLEQREREAREAYDLAGKRLRCRTIEQMKAMSETDFRVEQMTSHAAQSRWTEAHAALAAALAAARELATDR